jgi:hypothetical protein
MRSGSQSVSDFFRKKSQSVFETKFPDFVLKKNKSARNKVACQPVLIQGGLSTCARDFLDLGKSCLSVGGAAESTRGEAESVIK